MKLAGIQAVDADVNGRQPRLAPLGDIARQTITIGGHRNLTDGVVFTYRREDLGEIPAQRGFAAGETDLLCSHGGKGARHAAHFIHGEKAVIGGVARLVAVRQTVGATEIAHIGNRQTQVKKLTRECIGKL